MAHHQEDNTALSPEEKQFRDYIRRGDDFMKIEIYNHAKTWYTRAFNLHIDDKLASEKLQLVSGSRRFEKHTIIKILAGIIVVVAAAWIIHAIAV